MRVEDSSTIGTSLLLRLIASTSNIPLNITTIYQIVINLVWLEMIIL